MLKIEKVDEELAKEIYEFIKQAANNPPHPKAAQNLLHKIDYRPHSECEALAMKEFENHVGKYVLTTTLHSDELHGHVEESIPILVHVLPDPVKKWEDEAFHSARVKLFWRVKIVNTEDIAKLPIIPYYIEGTSFWENGKDEKPSYYTVTKFDTVAAYNAVCRAGQTISLRTKISPYESVTPELIKKTFVTLVADLESAGFDLSYLMEKKNDNS